MLNKKQIKVDELPKDWLVLDHWVPSGPADFVSYETVSEANDEFEECEDGCLNCWGNEICWKGNLPNETFGTKHIQLVAVNTGFRNDKIAMFKGVGYRSGEGFEIGKKNCFLANELKAKGKDFFIYEVMEEE